MILKTAIGQVQQATYWMEAAAEADYQKKTDPKKRDGSIEWEEAAYYLSILTGVQVSGEDVKIAYYSK